MDLNSTLSLLGLQPPPPSPHPGTSSGFCEICQKHVSNRTNHKFVHSHVSLFCVEPAGVWMFVWNLLLFHQLATTYWKVQMEWHLVIITIVTMRSATCFPALLGPKDLSAPPCEPPPKPLKFPLKPPRPPKTLLRPPRERNRHCRHCQPSLNQESGISVTACTTYDLASSCFPPQTNWWPGSGPMAIPWF